MFYAFYFTRRYDPYAILYYNDYGETWYHKSRAIAAMIECINDRWRNHPSYDGRLLIEAMGMQGHYSNSLNFDLLSGAMDRYLATGVNISLTEVDIELFGYNRDRSRIPTEAEFERQAYVFERVMRYALERHERVNRVTFWGIVDNGSIHWLYGRYANMFYENHQPKQAFWDVVALVDDPQPLPPPEITSTTLPDGNFGRAFSYNLAANGATPVIMWSVESGSLPEGLSVVPGSGVIFGVPQEEGEFTVTFRAENQFGSDTATLTLFVDEYVPREEIVEETKEPTAEVEEVTAEDPTPYEAQDNNEVTQEAAQEEPTPEAAQPDTDDNTSRNWVWIVALLVLAAAVAAWFVFRRSSKKA